MNKTRNPEYDERQLLVRAQAFKKTFLVFVFLVALVTLIEKEFQLLSMNAYVFLVIPIWLSITFLYVYCIHHDAYDGLSQDGTSGFIALMMGGIGVAVLGITLYKILGRGIPLVQDGIAQVTLPGLVAALCMMIIGIAYLIKKKKDKQITEED